MSKHIFYFNDKRDVQKVTAGEDFKNIRFDEKHLIFAVYDDQSGNFEAPAEIPLNEWEKLIFSEDGNFDNGLFLLPKLPESAFIKERILNFWEPFFGKKFDLFGHQENGASPGYIGLRYYSALPDNSIYAMFSTDPANVQLGTNSIEGYFNTTTGDQNSIDFIGWSYHGGFVIPSSQSPAICHCMVHYNGTDRWFTIDLNGWDMAGSTETEPIVFPVSRITEIELAAVNADFVTFVNNNRP